MAGTRTQSAEMEREMIAGIREGREAAMTQLYDRYSSIVYSVALRVLGDTGAAEDVLQDIFMQLWRKPESFDANRGSLEILHFWHVSRQQPIEVKPLR